LRGGAADRSIPIGSVRLNADRRGSSWEYARGAGGTANATIMSSGRGFCAPVDELNILGARTSGNVRGER